MIEQSWRKATRSAHNGACVQVRPVDSGGVQVRDSKNPEGLALFFTAAEWHAFLDGAKKGEFDHLAGSFPYSFDERVALRVAKAMAESAGLTWELPDGSLGCDGQYWLDRAGAALRALADPANSSEADRVRADHAARYSTCSCGFCRPGTVQGI